MIKFKPNQRWLFVFWPWPLSFSRHEDGLLVSWNWRISYQDLERAVFRLRMLQVGPFDVRELVFKDQS